ncbi:hypothetical protein DTO96_102423 [Ephemeroptericola cinctiostellae]|uniref:Uncharacterized protein n=1 Tax=Ephemeroptericola cinctiostellae TaxID=2268024 RepID=A0A345DE80_9BURK|nr:hypothetical protein [Ephemeroptericola cinctiostellae]AXF86668.1 hypothetical protein DTO96_102423 [Ephemeroptericola cinctiostellae]
MNTATQLVQAACIATGAKPTLRSYIHTSKAWYGTAAMPNNKADEILIQVVKSARLIGEFTITWPSYLDGYKIEIFNDALTAMSLCSDLLSLLEQHNNNLSPRQVIELLKRAGFADATPYDHPCETGAA